MQLTKGHFLATSLAITGVLSLTACTGTSEPTSPINIVVADASTFQLQRYISDKLDDSSANYDPSTALAEQVSIADFPVQMISRDDGQGFWLALNKQLLFFNANFKNTKTIDLPTIPDRSSCTIASFALSPNYNDLVSVLNCDNNPAATTLWVYQITNNSSRFVGGLPLSTLRNTPIKVAILASSVYLALPSQTSDNNSDVYLIDLNQSTLSLPSKSFSTDTVNAWGIYNNSAVLGGLNKVALVSTDGKLGDSLFTTGSSAIFNNNNTFSSFKDGTLSIKNTNKSSNVSISEINQLTIDGNSYAWYSGSSNLNRLDVSLVGDGGLFPKSFSYSSLGIGNPSGVGWINYGPSTL